MASVRAPILAVTHGGGPLPILNHPSQRNLTASMKTKCPAVLNLPPSTNIGPGQTQSGLDSAEYGPQGSPPRAIILITAHWETRVTHITSSPRPALIYDYSGFPPEAYSLKYDAPGSTEGAQAVAQALEKAGIESVTEDRGWDHGVFVPMSLIHPQATVPIIQVSVLANQDPAELLAVGRALAPLRDAPHHFAIVGSGSPSFHNLKALFTGQVHDPSFQSRQSHFNQELKKAVVLVEPDERARVLQTWRKWDPQGHMHPHRGAEHLSPLLVAAGAAGAGEAKHWTDVDDGSEMTSFWWK